MEQVTGFEPVPSAWQAEILPLYYTCTLAPREGIEPSSAGPQPAVLTFWTTLGIWTTRPDLNRESKGCSQLPYLIWLRVVIYFSNLYQNDTLYK